MGTISRWVDGSVQRYPLNERNSRWLLDMDIESIKDLYFWIIIAGVNSDEVRD